VHRNSSAGSGTKASLCHPGRWSANERCGPANASTICFQGCSGGPRNLDSRKGDIAPAKCCCGWVRGGSPGGRVHAACVGGWAPLLSLGDNLRRDVCFRVPKEESLSRPRRTYLCSISAVLPGKQSEPLRKPIPARLSRRKPAQQRLQQLQIKCQEEQRTINVGTWGAPAPSTANPSANHVPFID